MKRIKGKVLSALASLALLGCSPALQGTCSTDADCKSGESCGNGICLSAASSPDAGDAGNLSDAGDAGNTSDAGDAGNPGDAGNAGDAGNPGGDGGPTVTLTAPASGFVPGTFQVAAQTSAAGHVSFDLAPSAGGTTQGTAAVDATGAMTVSSSLKVSDSNFNGGALLHASLRTSDGRDVTSPGVVVTVDQIGPQVSTGFDGTSHWVAADGGYIINANVSDTDGSGVATAQLSVIESGSKQLTFPGTLATATATFTVDAKSLFVPGAVVLWPFSLSATDKVGNLGSYSPTLLTVLRVDDQPPVISSVVAVGGPWFRGQVPFTAAISDGAGSGVAASSIVLTAGATSAAGALDAGVATFNADFSALIDGGYEGPLFYQVTAKDNVGNVGSMDGSVSIDNVPPSVAVAAVTPADLTIGTAAWYGGDGGAISIHATIDGGAGSPIDVGSVSIDVDGGMAANLSEAKYSFDIPRTIGAGVEGPHTFKVQAADLAGNPSSGAVTLNFDTIPPTLNLASLVAPINWVQRAAGTTPAEFLVHDKGVGPGSVQLLSLDGTTVLATLAGGSDSTSFKGNLPLGWTPPNKEAAAVYMVVARDQLGNTSTATYQVFVDDVPPSIGPDNSNAANSAWHSAQAGNLTFNATVRLADGGSRVAGASLGPAAGSPPATGFAWNFAYTLPSDPNLENANYGPIAVTATDGVGNVSTDTTSFFFAVDNKPPSITGLAIATTADGSAAGVNWYRGPSNSPPTSTIDVTAIITDTYLDRSSPVALLAGAVLVSGSPDGVNPDLWHFAIPRAVGMNATGPIAISFDAQDQAKNHPANPTVTLNFDDGVTGSFAPAISADAAWHARTDSSANPIQIPVSASFVTLPNSGLQSVVLSDSARSSLGPTSQSSSTWQFSLAATDAPAGAEGSYSFSIVATSVVGVTTTVSGTRNIDDRPPSIAPDSANPANGAWHGVQASTLSFTASALITDNGSLVKSATMNGAQGNAPAAGSSAWTFPLTLPSDATIETDKYGPLTVTAQDNASNSSSDSTQIYFMLDNKPPAITGLSVATAADGVVAGANWYRGPNNSPPTQTLDLTATITEKYLDPAAPPHATIGNTTVTGNADTTTTGLWHFAIPRTVGSNATGAILVTLDAQDLAKNHSSKPTISLNFDDVAPASFAPAINADTGWHPRTNATGSAIPLPVTATFSKLPLSGIKTIQLAGNLNATSNTSTVYTFSLPATYAPAGVEKAFASSVVTTSGVGVSATSGVTRNIDDVPPVVIGAAINYSNAAAGTPLAWGHANSFTVRDSGTLYTFQTYDCGSGVGSVAATAFGQPVMASSGSTFACSNGAQAVLFNVGVTGNLATAHFTAVDNPQVLAATVSDAVASAGSAALHSASSSATANVTRRYWQTGNLGVSSLALGPSVVIGATGSGLVGLGAASGQGWTNTTAAANVAVGVYNGAPAVFTLQQSATNSSLTGTLGFFDPGTGAALGTACSQQVTTTASGNPFPQIQTNALALFTNGDAAAVVSEEVDWSLTAGGDIYPARTAGWRSSAGCPRWLNSSSSAKTYNNVLGTNFVIGRNSWTYFGVGDAATTNAPALIAANANGNGPISNASACSSASGVVAADNGGSDALICDGVQKWTFNGAGFAPSWSVANSALPPFLVAGSTNTILGDPLGGGNTSGIDLVSGGATIPAYAARAWLVDNSVVPNIFDSLPSGALEVRSTTGSSISGGLYALPTPVPNSPVADMIMDKTGILYVAAGGQVSALFTDSTGLGTNFNGWPVRGHDACRSSNLEYACPY